MLKRHLLDLRAKDPFDRSGRVGRPRIELGSFRLKGGCITLLLASLAFFWPGFPGRGLGFHRRLPLEFLGLLELLFFVWREGIEPLAKRPPGYNRLEPPLLRARHERWGLLERRYRSF